MFQRLNQRAGHYALLLLTTAALCLPNLGAPSLWDIDEGNNAEAAREMLEAGDWVVPTFNYQLRPDKPALLYWLQIYAYQSFGINEFSARLPSALAALATVLLLYEFGRRLFGTTTGLLAGLILSSTLGFCASAHFANPDALLNLFTLLALFSFWIGQARGGRWWFVPFGVSTGLAMLTKGPVGLLLPGLIVFLFLLWTRQLRTLLDGRAFLGWLAFGLVVVPWYGWVAVETKGDFITGFVMTHNVGRYLAPMEHHGGPFYYYLLILAVGLAPWSVFLGPAFWYAVGRRARADGDFAESNSRQPQAPYRFVWCWLAVYLVFFSCSRTKLPNYILPLYPALALLLARFLDRWRRGTITPPGWILAISLALLALIGLGTATGLLVAGGTIPVTAWEGRQLAGLGKWAFLGAAPFGGALLGAWYLRRQRRDAVIVTISAAAVVFLAGLAAWGGVALNACKAPQPLADALPADQQEQEIRVACYRYFRPSLVFYCRREVQSLTREVDVDEFLSTPLPVYVFMPAAVWETLEGRLQRPHRVRVLERRHDIYSNGDVVVLTNQ